MSRLAIVLIALFLAAGCGDRQEKQLKHVRSWSATAARIGELWAQDEVPTPYARKALDKARHELKDAPDVAERVADLRSALEQGERERARRLAAELRP